MRKYITILLLFISMICLGETKGTVQLLNNDIAQREKVLDKISQIIPYEDTVGEGDEACYLTEALYKYRASKTLKTKKKYYDLYVKHWNNVILEIIQMLELESKDRL